MEMDNGTRFSCSHGEEMLAYLCDELSPEGRERFEEHMQGCFECIDEFAELAVSRYSVFEWKSIEFDPLPTPKFVVPAETKPAFASWLDGIRAAIAWQGWAPGGGAAAILLLAVIGISVWNVRPDAMVTGNDPEQVPDAVPVNVQTAPAPSDTPETAENASVQPESEPQQVETILRRPGAARKLATIAKSVTARKEPAASVQTRRTTPNQRLQNSPTLGQYVEDRDESLRLSDIFDDLDTKDME